METLSIFGILAKGGWLMIPIALASVAVIALGIGRFLTLRRGKQELHQFLEKWESAPPSTDPNRYLADCANGPWAVAEMAKVIGDNTNELAPQIESIAQSELHHLETGLGMMATLAAATPLLGFLGTVTGMIRAFMKVSYLGGGSVNANVLAGGIWEALVTTAAGLTVGIVALVIHNYLAGLVSGITQRLEDCGDSIMRALIASKRIP
ncbi:MAG: MotA/TolQ/ExbB proton channel family protein [Candidatus Electryoneaceae bacterium]|nr:MotA/TolQ/ExbB proton channel family protein [Candidatus Electryoneaceae bacterium]